MKTRTYKTGPLKIRGVEYANKSAAAAALGISKAAIGKAQARGAIDNVATGIHGNAGGDNNRKMTRFMGKQFESRAAAAAAFGLSGPELSTFLKVARKIGLTVG